MYNLFEYEAGFNLFKNSYISHFEMIYFIFILMIFGVEFILLFLSYLNPNLLVTFLIFSYTFFYFLLLFFLENSNA